MNKNITITFRETPEFRNKLRKLAKKLSTKSNPVTISDVVRMGLDFVLGRDKHLK